MSMEDMTYDELRIYTDQLVQDAACKLAAFIEQAHHFGLIVSVEYMVKPDTSSMTRIDARLQRDVYEMLERKRLEKERAECGNLH